MTAASSPSETPVPSPQEESQSETSMADMIQGSSQTFNVEALREHDYLEMKSDREIYLEEKLNQKEEELSEKEKELKEKEKRLLKLEEMVRKRDRKIANYKYKLKLEKMKLKRLKSKTATLKDLITNLKDKHLISDNHQDILENKFSHVYEELINRVKKVRKGNGRKYSPLLRSFALTLQFYSTKAYNFVRRVFSLSLPHQRTIRKWYSGIPAEPGFTEPAFR